MSLDKNRKKKHFRRIHFSTQFIIDAILLATLRIRICFACYLIFASGMGSDAWHKIINDQYRVYLECGERFEIRVILKFIIRFCIVYCVLCFCGMFLDIRLRIINLTFFSSDSQDVLSGVKNFVRMEEILKINFFIQKPPKVRQINKFT